MTTAPDRFFSISDAELMISEDGPTIAQCLRSHDLRTPLHAILGGAELLAQGALGKLSGDAKAMLGDMIKAGHRMESMLNRLVELEDWAERPVERSYGQVNWHEILSNAGLEGPATYSSTPAGIDSPSLKEAFSITSTLVGASHSQPGTVGVISAEEWRISGPGGEDPQSGNGLVHAFLARRLFKRSGLEFTWKCRGEVALEFYNDFGAESVGEG